MDVDDVPRAGFPIDAVAPAIRTERLSAFFLADEPLDYMRGGSVTLSNHVPPASFYRLCTCPIGDGSGGREPELSLRHDRLIDAHETFLRELQRDVEFARRFDTFTYDQRLALAWRAHIRWYLVASFTDGNLRMAQCFATWVAWATEIEIAGPWRLPADRITRSAYSLLLTEFDPTYYFPDDFALYLPRTAPELADPGRSAAWRLLVFSMTGERRPEGSMPPKLT